MNSTITTLFMEQVRRSPSALAVSEPGCQLTYAELEERSRRLAVELLSAGIARNSVVALCLERSVDFVASALGIMRAGAAYLPLEPAHPSARLQFQIENAGAKILVTNKVLSARKSLAAPRIIFSDPLDLPSVENEQRALETFPEDLAYVIYTSGSSGQPKGVEITHRNLCNLIAWHCSTFHVNFRDRASQVASVGFDAGVWEVWPYLACGASVHVASEAETKDPALFQEWLLQNGVTCSFAPTRMAECMMNLHWSPGAALRLLLTGGERLLQYPPPGLPFTVVNNYGPTECSVVATSGIVSPEAAPLGPPPIGKPIANAFVYLLDENQQPVGAGKDGEIFVAGAGVARGYRNQPELTAEKFKSGVSAEGDALRVYRTGDLGRLLPDGQIAFVGRCDAQVKVRGCRAEPEEIEFLLGQHPAVRQGAVLASETSRGGIRLVAYLAAQPGRGLDSEEIRSFLAARLPEFMIPSQVVWLETLPVTPNGKTDRNALLQMILADQQNGDSTGAAGEVAQPQRAVAAATSGRTSLRSPAIGGNGSGRIHPKDDIERRLQAIWEEILEVHPVTLNADFFPELGGDSLQAVQLFTEIENVWGVRLPVSLLMERCTVERLAQAIRKAGESKNHSPLVPLQVCGTKSPIFCIASHDGDALFFRHLADYVGPAHPVYGFQSKVRAKGRVPATIEDTAESYVDELLQAEPTGPYALFGFCYGGLVAFEMAQRLVARGSSVEFLSMFNTPPPGSLAGWPLGQLSYLSRRIGAELHKLPQLEGAKRRGHVLRNAQKFGQMIVRSAKIDAWRMIHRVGSAEMSRRAAERLLDAEQTNIAVGKNYRPGSVFPGRIRILMSGELPYPYSVPAESGWRPYAARGIEIIQVPRLEGVHPSKALLQAVAENLRESSNTPIASLGHTSQLAASGEILLGRG